MLELTQIKAKCGSAFLNPLQYVDKLLKISKNKEDKEFKTIQEYLTHERIFKLIKDSGGNITEILVNLSKESDGKISLLSLINHSIERNSPETVKLILSKGVYPSSVDSRNIVPLIQAVRYNDHVSLNALIDAKVNVNAKDREGWTALHHAVKNESPEFVKALIAAKANPNIKAPISMAGSFIEMTPLEFAKYNLAKNIFKDKTIMETLLTCFSHAPESSS